MRELTWRERQTEECGFTRKCCSCKYGRPLDEYEKPDHRGDMYCTCIGKVKDHTCTKTLKRDGRERVFWWESCFWHIWKYAEGEQVELDV